MIELHGRYSKRVNAMLLILGASLLLYVGFVDPGGPFSPLCAFLGVVACALGLRAFDRRVKLILGPEGLLVRAMGPAAPHLERDRVDLRCPWASTARPP